MSESNDDEKRLSGNQGETFAKRNLIQLKVDTTNWMVLWKNPATGEFWKEFFPQSELQGGGPPEYVLISFENAVKEFGEIG